MAQKASRKQQYELELHGRAAKYTLVLMVLLVAGIVLPLNGWLFNFGLAWGFALVIALLIVVSVHPVYGVGDESGVR